MPASSTPSVSHSNPPSIVSLAASHGLTLQPESTPLEGAGLDFRVAFAAASDGTEWVLRIPRRADVAARLEEEARTLAFIAPRVPVALPDWRICTPTLVAYPRLPGTPGLTIDPETKAPRFHLDPTSEIHAASLGRFIAARHAIDPQEARRAGLPFQSAEDVRSTWASQLATVSSAFTHEPQLAARWGAWLDDDGLWPQHTVLTHGELYAAHLLVDEALEVRSVLDWTTAKVGDPALDFAYQHLIAGSGFEATVRAYLDAGGSEHPRLAERCAEIMAAAPIHYGIYALTTGTPETRDIAASMLNQ